MNHIAIIGEVDRIIAGQDDFVEALIITHKRHSATQEVDTVLHPCKFTGRWAKLILNEEGTEVAIEGTMINESGQYKLLVNNLLLL